MHNYLANIQPYDIINPNSVYAHCILVLPITEHTCVLQMIITYTSFLQEHLIYFHAQRAQSMLTSCLQ